MKTSINLLLASIVTVLCCSTAQAQTYTNSINNATLVYSNAFNGGAVDINGTAPTYINPSAPSFGGSLSAAFDVVSNNAAKGYLGNQDGTLGASGDTVLLPFTPVSGYVYTLSYNLTYTVTPPAGGWGGIGFGTHFPVSNTVGTSGDRFNDSGVGGNPWTLLNMFANAGGAILEASGGSQGQVTGLMTTLNTPYTINLILDTTGAKWIVFEYINGTFVKSYTYPTTNPALLSLGCTQTTTTAGAFKWGPMELFASPMVITINPASASVAAGVAFTNTITVASTNTSYQWYYNTVSNYAGGIALTNNGRILGSTTNSLVFTNIISGDAGYYFVVVTNVRGGALTSSVASLAVFGAPTIATAYPVVYTNPFTLFAGTNVTGTNYPGASPVFSVSAIGQAPLNYQWRTNGVAVGGATNASFTFTNCQLTSPTSFACVVTNAGGAATNTWSTTYVQEPGVLFANTVMSYNPAGFWRLNEGGDDGNGDNGAVATDYAGGNNGLYTNAFFSQPTYANADSTAASVRFNFAGTPSDVFAVQGIDYSNKVNAAFTVQGWIKGVTAQPSGAPIIAKGYNGGEQFALDITGNKYRFLVRNAAGTASSVTAPTGLDNNWHFIVGVCDELNGTVSLYVDGLQAAASQPITPGSGMFATTTPVTFGARGSTPIVYDDLQFSGFLSDLAVYNSALSPIQVANLYSAAGFAVGFTFVPPLPPTNYVFLANTTITIPATVFCPQGNNGYYWTNLTTGSVIASGTASAPGNLNATLSIPAASPTLSGDLLELVVTNAVNSTNWFVTLFSPAPPIALDYSSPILYSNFFNGGALSIGGVPVTAANLLVGGTNAMWNIVSNNPAGGYAAYGDGTLAANLDCVLLPFTPHSGYVYTLEASLTFTVTPPAGGWGGLGFSTQFPTNYVVDARILNQGWALLNMGANGGGALLNANGASQGGTPNLMTSVNTPYDIQVILNTTAPQWSVALYVAGTFVTNYVYTTGNPGIVSFGYDQTTTTAGAFKWNSIALTQVASNAPPYLLNPLPPASLTVGAGTTLSLPATAFSSFVPYGYTWSNLTAVAVLGSGTTNNVAPLAAGLGYPNVPNGWTGVNTLALVLTNAYGTNITFVSVTVTNSAFIPTNKPVIASFSFVGNNVVINATNGQSGGTYYLLGTTNLVTPLSQWLPLSTNVILTNSAANGFTFTGTNAIHAAIPQQFYILSNTN